MVGPTDALQHLNSREAGQHQVQQNQVVWVGLSVLQPFTPIVGYIDGVAFRDQAALHQRRNLRFVLRRRIRTQVLLASSRMNRFEVGMKLFSSNGQLYDTIVVAILRLPSCVTLLAKGIPKWLIRIGNVLPGVSDADIGKLPAGADKDPRDKPLPMLCVQMGRHRVQGKLTPGTRLTSSTRLRPRLTTHPWPGN